MAPAGQELRLAITAEVDPRRFAKGDEPAIEELEADVERLFSVILGLLDSDRVAFGKRKGAGWGRVRIAEPSEIKDGKPPYSLTKARLDDVEGLKAWLKGKPISGTDGVGPAKLGADNRITIDIEWESPTGILVAETDEEKQEEKQKDAAKPGVSEGPQGEAENADGQKSAKEKLNVAHPLRAYKTADGEQKAPLVLPGSSVRGALRTRASRIARTILYRKREDETPDWSNVPVHDQLANDPTLVRALFGTTERRGAVTVLDTLSIPSEDNKAEKLRTVTHNAGDRWTGGVIDGGLYEEEYPVPKWNVLRIEVDPERVVGPSQSDDGPQDDAGPKANAGSKAEAGPHHDGGSQGAPGADNRRDKTALRRQQAAICLLGLTLAELATGTLPLGSRGTRGMGEVKVNRLTIKGPEDILPPPAQEWDIHDDDDGSVAEKLLAQLREVNKKLQKGAAEGLDLNWTDFLNEKDKKA